MSEGACQHDCMFSLLRLFPTNGPNLIPSWSKFDINNRYFLKIMSQNVDIYDVIVT